MTERATTVCPLCGVGCRLKAGDGGRARGVPGPANPEGRLCSKGVGAFDVGDDRVTEPLVRRDGRLRPVSWATALDRAAEGLRAVRTAVGSDGLAFLGAPHCTNEENYLLQKIARTLGTNNVDNRARLCHVSAARTLAERLGWPATTNSLADVREADVVIVAGANPAERQPIAFNSFVRPAVRDGTTLVHVDPVANETTRLADYHVAPRPGRDATVFDLFSARLLADGDGVDRSFVADRTRGFDRFGESMADYDRERAVSAAGVDADSVARVGDELAAADTIAAMVGTGIEGGDGETAAALLDLLLLTGSVGRPGTGLFVLRGLANEQGAVDAGCVPDYLPGYQPVTERAARDRVADEWGVTPPSTPGKNARELLAAFGEGVRGALVVGENPAVSKREREWLQRRLDGLDTLVVVDIMPNSTTEHADVVLPAAAGVEKSGSLTNLERRVQRFPRAATAPGDARPDLDILSELGARLTGKPASFDYDGPEAVFDELSRVAPTHAGIAYADLDAGGRQWPFDSDGVLYRATFDTDDGLAAFGTARSVPERDSADSLRLVTGGRTSEFADDSAATAVLRLAAADAAERNIDAGDEVIVTDGVTEVVATAQVDEGTRSGTVYLPAIVADPLLRSGGSTVRLDPA
ncbi:molybdopterin-dependent oxidoreductase [Haloarcula sp. S1CR25-12]|uniref:Molybdopterin-dependent oxidoreductase n=1 Tax=Haloarcula saliterrae TaxID=2950534 RepID=A0ABU2FG14_9EURY|nr:molybdopterin-dependent oxidoreductase [Haloarcula sp. S1CR25-12]MDS0261191.1 molybdopterin-dependent oxidoreductase [Haloarcula sp. S1CR25-12]